MDGERGKHAAVYLAEKPATWTFRLPLAATSRSKAYVHQPDMDQDHGLPARTKKTFFVVHWDFSFCKWEDEHLYFKRF